MDNIKDEAFLIANLVLAVLLLLEQYLGLSTCKSNCLAQLVFNNLFPVKKCVEEPKVVVS